MSSPTSRTPALLRDVTASDSHLFETLNQMRRRLVWLAMTRVATMVVLVFATTILTEDTTYLYLRGVRSFLIWVGLMGLIPSSLYFPAIYSVRTVKGLRIIAFMMAIQDMLFSTALVLATGGTQSAFTFFFSLTIIIAGITLGRPGTVFSVILATGLMCLIGLYEARVITYPRFIRDFLIQGSPYAIITAIGTNAFGFGAVGFLSQYLVEQMRRADIQRERYRESLEDLRQLHECILASVGVGIVTCRLDHIILHINRAAERFLGLTLRQARGQHLSRVFPEALEAIERNQKVFETERHLEDGTKLVLLASVAPLIASDGRMIGHIVSLEDISQLKAMEARLKAEERLATIGKLAAVVAHEIRNPLAAISASAQMLASNPDLGEEGREATDIVIRETDRLNTWISDLLEYARPKRGETVVLSVPDLVQEVADVVKRDPASRLVSVLVDIEDEAKVVGDPQRLFRVLMNLVKNGIEAMPSGGSLRIACWKEGPQWKGEGRGGDLNGQSFVVISVSDNGCGIPRQDLDRIFEPFFTTKPQGTGLGLAIVAQVVEEHGGTIEVESHPSVGTTFTIRLPAVS